VEMFLEAGSIGIRYLQFAIEIHNKILLYYIEEVEVGEE
jgi:hypothetical protein